MAYWKVYPMKIVQKNIAQSTLGTIVKEKAYQ